MRGFLHERGVTSNTIVLFSDDDLDEDDELDGEAWDDDSWDEDEDEDEDEDQDGFDPDDEPDLWMGDEEDEY